MKTNKCSAVKLYFLCYNCTFTSIVYSDTFLYALVKVMIIHILYVLEN